MFKYRKASFPKSVSTTFVAHCLEAIYANCGDFLFISKLQQVYFYKSDYMRSSEGFLTEKKVTTVVFLTENRIQRRNLVYPGSMFGPQRGVYRDFFAFKAFKECLPHFHSMQFSLLHHVYKCFSIQLSYVDEKTEIVSFLGKNLYV